MFLARSGRLRYISADTSGIIRLHSLTMSRGESQFLGGVKFLGDFQGGFSFFVNQQRGDLNFLCCSLYF